MTSTRPWRWLALLPPLALLVGAPLANRVHPYVLGLPFLLFWIVACVLLTSAVMAFIGALDRRRDAFEARAHAAAIIHPDRRAGP
jgi:4-hydroxybenzoate polyprenyltransferase